MNIIFSLAVGPIIAPSASPSISPEPPETKTFMAFFDNDEDSEEFPTEIRVGNYNELKMQLAQMVGMKDINAKDIRIILNMAEVILSIQKIQNGAEYNVSKKVKTNLVKLYITLR